MKRVLYVTGATGPRYEAHLSYTLPLMQKHLGEENILITYGKRPGNLCNFVWTMLPLDSDYRRKYNRIVWIDADVEILSPDFAEFGQLDIEAEAYGVLDMVPEDAARIRLLAKREIGSDVPFDRPYVNAGVVCLDLNNIDPENWEMRLDWWRKAASFPSWDQALFYCMVDAAVAPPKFNVYYSLRDLFPDAVAIHYNYKGDEPKRVLDNLCGWKGK